jgi:hypothetical protein
LNFLGNAQIFLGQQPNCFKLLDQCLLLIIGLKIFGLLKNAIGKTIWLLAMAIESG